MFLYNREALIIKTKLFLIIFILSIFIPTTAQANDSIVPYSIEANLPENQVNNDVSYFDIEMETGESQTLEVIIYNSSNEEITVHINNTVAATNSNGLIIYDSLTNEEKPHESMHFPFSDISTLESNEITIPAGESKITKVNVNAPNKSFDGIILGGLYFTLDSNTNDNDENLTIQNKYSYALAVQIKEKGNSNEVEPKLELLSVHPGVIDYRTGVQSEFVNTSPVIIKNLTIEANVYQLGDEEPLYTNTKEDFIVAPNSKFHFPIMYNNQKLKPGDYVFQASASNEDKSWKFEENFEITEEIADESNKEAVELEEDSKWLLYIIIGLAVVIVLLTIILIAVLKRKD